ncbi:hypothetical protein [Bartonella sp. AA78NXGY]|uniref:hypothetical protein n=1 Tax=Bartonella sp. AA78NXGY TaxID=3243437 RepID=UPI0035D10BF5
MRLKKNTKNNENAPHPSELLREDVNAKLGLSVIKAAEEFSISRVAFSRVLVKILITTFSAANSLAKKFV